MMGLRRIACEEKGASAVEFALLAPTLLMFMFGIIEGSRMIWTKQVVQRSAHSAARCHAPVR